MKRLNIIGFCLVFCALLSSCATVRHTTLKPMDRFNGQTFLIGKIHIENNNSNPYTPYWWVAGSVSRHVGRSIAVNSKNKYKHHHKGPNVLGIIGTGLEIAHKIQKEKFATSLMDKFPVDSIAESLNNRFGLILSTDEYKGAKFGSSTWVSDYSVGDDNYINITINFNQNSAVNYTLEIESGRQKLVIHSDAIITDRLNDPVRRALNEKFRQENIKVPIDQISKAPEAMIPLLGLALRRDLVREDPKK